MRAPASLSARSIFAIAILGMVLLGSGIYFGVNYAVQRAVVVDAEDKAHHWTEYFLTAMPDLDRLLAGGELTPAQAQVITTAETVGDVFRFKLYSPAARQVLVSDDASEADEDDDNESPDHNATAAAVLATHRPNIELHDRAESGMPPIYVEAYVPIAGKSGPTHGVVEVYIDQTGTAGLLRTTFAALAVGLAIVAALAFGLPTLAFLFRSRQVRDARREAEFLAHHDPLTGLLNRTAFADRVRAALVRPPGETATLVAFDIDAFKAINETYGEAAGDLMLKHAGRALTGALRAGEVAGRPGDDHFVVLLRNRPPDEVRAYAETALAMVREPISVEGHAVGARLSAGIYEIEPDDDVARAIYRADVALYQGKVDGGNVARRFSTAMESKIAARRALETRLREAVRDQGFVLHFQPLVAAATGRCSGFEALLRLPDGAGGMISPAVFIPVAEDIGLITEIGAWVLGEATRIAATWPEDLFVAVNLSVQQFGDRRLVETVRQALAASGLAARRLELEVTESMLMESASAVGAQLSELRDLDISIAMDDFGTGYSSLGYLWQFGFDKLKIDRSFVMALDADEARAREVLDTIVVLGHKLDMRVTAEGIQTERQAEVLTALGCDHLQGFLYARPLPATELAAFLLRSRRPAGRPAARRRRTAIHSAS
jgi:diguanylate cyclase (GGDEF)-like protein